MWMTRVSINNPVFATMVMVALCVLGLFSYARLGVEQMPDVSLPVAFIDVAYPGASPEAVEREVTKLVEEALNSIAGVKRITSRSFEGRSQTSVEFTLERRHGARDAGRARPHGGGAGGVPQRREGADGEPLRRRQRQPTVVMACSAPDGRSPRELSLMADQTVYKRLQRVEGVARVDVSGWPRARCASTWTPSACALTR